ncbi:MAG: DNA-3-methyladenine glycosylase I [Pirellulaceae bacterium]|nr:DNA-3-methyladenine glycosylase I [Pirellulaceae bacterium]
MNDKKTRCPWVDLSKPDYVAYHDEEWGVPVYNDQKLFESLTLESAQAGLNWYTILQKRENYRTAFSEFDPQRVASFTERRVTKLMQNAGIVRHRLKIEATINNAKQFMKVQNEFGSFATFLWEFVEGKPRVNQWSESEDSPTTTRESDRLSKELKRRGFKFVGSTICYAHMQATGLVNDHSSNCFRYQEIIQQFA